MARNFNGTSDFVQTALQTQSYCTGADDSHLTSFVFSAWAWLTSGAGAFPMVMCAASGGPQLMFGINIGSFAGLNLFLAGLQSKNAATFTTGVWHHVACRYVSNGAATGTITVFDNGTDVTVGNTGTTTVAVADTHNLQIANTQSGNSFWKGNIADVAIWKAATTVSPLTNSEIVALSAGARPYQIRPGNLIRWWPIDGLQSPEPEFSGAADNGTLTGTALATTAPPVMQFTPRWPQFNTIAVTTPIKFRKTLSQIGGRVGSRQPQGWAA